MEKKKGAKKKWFFLVGEKDEDESFTNVDMFFFFLKVMVPWIFDLRFFSYGESSANHHQKGKYEIWLPLLHKNEKSKPTMGTAK